MFLPFAPSTQVFRLLIFAVLILTGCNSERQVDNYNLDPSFTPSNLNLTQLNHPHGFGRSECFVCHLPVNIHQVDRLGNNSAQLALANQYTNTQGLPSCRGCHGTNGIP